MSEEWHVSVSLEYPCFSGLKLDSWHSFKHNDEQKPILNMFDQMLFSGATPHWGLIQCRIRPK